LPREIAVGRLFTATRARILFVRHCKVDSLAHCMRKKLLLSLLFAAETTSGVDKGNVSSSTHASTSHARAGPSWLSRDRQQNSSHALMHLVAAASNSRCPPFRLLTEHRFLFRFHRGVCRDGRMCVTRIPRTCSRCATRRHNLLPFSPALEVTARSF
jgi:hypothetical protein